MFDLKTKILIVDDMLAMRKIVKKLCIEIGFSDFVEAPNGAIAWEALSPSTSSVGLIISDWNMPIMTGIEFLKKVRADENFKSIPFVMVTAEGEKHQIAEAVAAGVSNYVVKPFSAPMLAEKIESVWKSLKK